VLRLIGATIILSCVPLLQAQVSTATILGTVNDSSGAVVPKAQVTAINVDTNVARSTETDQVGQYSIPFLPTGTYRVEVTSGTFKKFVQTGVVLDVGRSARIDPVLEIGAVTETVSVTADAPLVNTTTA